MHGRVYRLCTVWRVAAPPEACWDEIARVLRPGARMWWPGVRLSSAPAALVPGASFVLDVRAPLRYRLRMRMRFSRVEPGRALAAESSGDLRGSGALRIDAVPDGSELRFSWTVVTTRRWMRATAWVLGPVFAAGHSAVMRAGERELRRRLHDMP